MKLLLDVVLVISGILALIAGYGAYDTQKKEDNGDAPDVSMMGGIAATACIGAIVALWLLFGLIQLIGWIVLHV